MNIKSTLTKVELQLMNIIWDLPDGGCAWDVLEHYEEPKPAYSTVATNLKILHAKGYLDFRKGQGKTLIYYPLISRDSYTRLAMSDVKRSLFGGSLKSMFSFFVQEEKLSEEELLHFLHEMESEYEQNH